MAVEPFQNRLGFCACAPVASPASSGRERRVGASPERSVLGRFMAHSTGRAPHPAGGRGREGACRARRGGQRARRGGGEKRLGRAARVGLRGRRRTPPGHGRACAGPARRRPAQHKEGEESRAASAAAGRAGEAVEARGLDGERRLGRGGESEAAAARGHGSRIRTQFRLPASGFRLPASGFRHPNCTLRNPDRPCQPPARSLAPAGPKLRRGSGCARVCRVTVSEHGPASLTQGEPQRTLETRRPRSHASISAFVRQFPAHGKRRRHGVRSIGACDQWAEVHRLPVESGRPARSVRRQTDARLARAAGIRIAGHPAAMHVLTHPSPPPARPGRGTYRRPAGGEVGGRTASPTATVSRLPSRCSARSIVAALMAWSGFSIRRASLSATSRPRVAPSVASHPKSGSEATWRPSPSRSMVAAQS